MTDLAAYRPLERERAPFYELDWIEASEFLPAPWHWCQVVLAAPVEPFIYNGYWSRSSCKWCGSSTEHTALIRLHGVSKWRYLLQHVGQTEPTEVETLMEEFRSNGVTAMRDGRRLRS